DGGTDLSTVKAGPPLRSRLSMTCSMPLAASDEQTNLPYSNRWLSGDQTPPQMPLCSSSSKNFRAFSPSGPISQASRSPHSPRLVLKAIHLPSGETFHAPASSRSLRAAPPTTANVQMLGPELLT